MYIHGEEEQQYYLEEIANFIKQGYTSGQFEGQNGKTISWTAKIEINTL